MHLAKQVFNFDNLVSNNKKIFDQKTSKKSIDWPFVVAFTVICPLIIFVSYTILQTNWSTHNQPVWNNNQVSDVIPLSFDNIKITLPYKENSPQELLHTFDIHFNVINDSTQYKPATLNINSNGNHEYIIQFLVDKNTNPLVKIQSNLNYLTQLSKDDFINNLEILNNNFK